MNNGEKDKSVDRTNRSEKIDLLSLFSIISLPENSKDSGYQGNYEKQTMNNFGHLTRALEETRGDYPTEREYPQEMSADPDQL